MLRGIAQEMLILLWLTDAKPPASAQKSGCSVNEPMLDDLL